MVSVELKNHDIDADSWNKIVSSFQNAHVFQTWQWGQFKKRYGWNAYQKYWGQDDHQVYSVALVLERKIQFFRFSPVVKIVYIPKGPLFNWIDEDKTKLLLTKIKEFAINLGAVFIKLDPDITSALGIPGDSDYKEIPSGQRIKNILLESGWIYSPEQIQFPNTVTIELTHNSDDILASMKQKTRYNIRLAEKKGVRVRHGTVDDLDILYTLYAQTSIRDGFVIRDKQYYFDLWKEFIQCGIAVPLLAEFEDIPIAAAIPFMFAGRCWFLYGMSSDHHRDKMPNYLIQWHIIQNAKERGCSQYDMWGAPNEFNSSDRLWKVFRFKIGFGGNVVHTLGAWDLPLNPFLYSIYHNVLPMVLSLMRKRGKHKTQHSLGM